MTAATAVVGDRAAPEGGLAGWALSVMENLGAPGAGALIALENLFPPIPSEVILPLGGFAAAQGRFGVVAVIAWTTVGSTVGALVLRALGAWLGVERLRRVAHRVPLLSVRDIDRGSAWFARHGSWAVFCGRMLPLFRSVVSIPAGIERMPVVRFTVLTLAGSAVWNTAFVLAGYALGGQWHRIDPYAGALEKAVIAVCVVAVVVFVARRLRARGRAERR